MARLLVGIAALSLSACAGHSLAPASPVDQQVTLAPGQSATIVDAVAVAFIRVQADSRCPADAICIQGGDALVQLRVSVDRETRDLVLHENDRRPATYGGLTIALVQLSPYPFSSHPIQPDEYRATVRVTR